MRWQVCGKKLRWQKRNRDAARYARKEGEEGRARDKTSGGVQSQAAEGRGRRRLAHTSHRGGEELRDQETDEATQATRG